MLMRRVVITGMGLLTPLGRGVRENWTNLLAGRTGVIRCERKGRPESLRYLGSVEGFDQLEDIPPKLSGQTRFLNRGSKLGFEAAREAVLQSGVRLEEIPPERRALFIASGDLTKTGFEFIYPALRDALKGNDGAVNYPVLNKSTLNKVNPFFLLESLSNNLFSFLSAVFEFMGPNTSLASHSPGGAQAMELAARRIASGEADIALAVGCGNWITEIPMYEMKGLGILSRCRRGERSFRPLDRDRDGFIPGEGGAAVLLEDAESAERRGASILGEVKGFGGCIEPPAGKGLSVPEKVAVRAMEAALEEAGTDVGELGFICPHGSGTRRGDRSELESISDLLGERRSLVPVCALKPYTGHMGAASDLCEVIIGVRAIAEGMVPGTLNFARAERDFEDLRISSATQPASGRNFLSVSYGIIGQSSSVLVEGRPAAHEK
ncbi:MAG: beta-ketoacyl-[acyl-carrier-protein] synthase family protein [Desulfobacteraceae bacterium]|nr:beta-ketoacyl-[acyl-carrier-protein] synthase family protein [Desulfobacteraceae bacterium]